jgi:monomeric phenylalanine-4-hydroxylase
LNERLTRATGWQVVAVPGLVPDEVFFEHLANRRFVAGRFIRKPDQFDYLQEPDIFHDVFGHVPLLVHPVFADYMQAYGEGGLRAARLGMMRPWRGFTGTVEFGLIRDGSDLKLYGAGIVSSYGESVFALDDPSPHRIAFDLERVMRSQYRIDDYQQNYFVIESFEDLLQQTRDADLGPIYERLRGHEPIAVGTLLPPTGFSTRARRTMHAPGPAYDASDQAFAGLEPQQPDGLLALIAQCRADPRPDKVDVGVGVYRGEAGGTPVMRAVKAAEAALGRQASKSYLGAEGDERFARLVWQLVSGEERSGERRFGLQTPAGRAPCASGPN